MLRFLFLFQSAFGVKRSIQTLPTAKKVSKSPPPQAPARYLEDCDRSYSLPNLNLGEGSFGSVSCFQQEDGSLCATKSFENLEKTYRFKEALEMWEKFEHPNIIKCHKIVFDENGNPKEAKMDYGGWRNSLQDWIELDLLTLLSRDFRNIAHQLFTGVQYIHGHNCVHGDLKPGNLLYDMPGLVSGNIKIVDFDFMVNLDNPPKEKRAFATEEYSPPEAWDEMVFNNIVPRQEYDVWSCGMTLFHTFYGDLPFTCKHAATLRMLLERDGLRFIYDPKSLLVRRKKVLEPVREQLVSHFLKTVLVPQFQHRPSVSTILEESVFWIEVEEEETQQEMKENFKKWREKEAHRKLLNKLVHAREQRELRAQKRKELVKTLFQHSKTTVKVLITLWICGWSVKQLGKMLWLIMRRMMIATKDLKN